jgi:hypothetical protein
MVRLGMAWAFVRYSRDYVEFEERAKAESLGVHPLPKLYRGVSELGFQSRAVFCASPI